MSLSRKFFVYFCFIIFLASFLRIYRLSTLPPALYSDEIDQGYNAYSILKTGKDEHGYFLPVSLRSFGDYKPPLPTVVMIPFIAIFGLNEWSVRIPSALLGIFTIPITMVLVLLLFPNQKKIALITGLLLSLSPWHIFQSRCAMLVMASLFFWELGLVSFYCSLRKKTMVIICVICFSLSIYGYYAMRVITPVTLFILLVIYKAHLIAIKRYIIAGFAVMVIIVLPLFLTSISTPNVIIGRAKTISVFYDKGVEAKRRNLSDYDEYFQSVFSAKFFHHASYLYGRDIIRRYFSHFSPAYLLLIGDTAPPFQIPNMGVLYGTELLFFFIGIKIIFHIDKSKLILLLTLVCISILPAAFTFITPTSNRTFSEIVPFTIISAFGYLAILKRRHTFILSVLVSVIVSVQLFIFLNKYFQILPKENSLWWNYGWKQVVEYVKNNEKKYDTIVVDGIDGMPYVYFLFYLRYDPSRYQKEAIRTYIANEYGYEQVEGFGKYIFTSQNWTEVKDNKQFRTLYIMMSKHSNFDRQDLQKTIYYPNGLDAFSVYSIK